MYEVTLLVHSSVIGSILIYQIFQINLNVSSESLTYLIIEHCGMFNSITLTRRKNVQD